MKGVVQAINSQRGTVAIGTESHGFTILELLSDSDLDIGDVMTWTNDTGMGGETYRNATKGLDMGVYVQNHWVPAQQLGGSY